MKKIRQLINGEGKDEMRMNEASQINKNIVGYLIKNVYLQNKIQFYMSLDDKAMQTLLSSVFKSNNLNHQSKIFVIGLLKKHTFIINIAFSNNTIDFKELFDFLLNEKIDYGLLNAFEDIYLPFCTVPLNRFLIMLTKQSNIKQTFLSHIYTKQIFKILHTAVFCCQEQYFKETEQILHQIMKSLAHSVFNYSPHPEDKQKKVPLLEFGQVSWNLKDFISDLTLNLTSVELFLVDHFLSLIDGKYIQIILAHFNKLRQNQNYEEYCEGIIYILINLLKLLQSFKLSINTKNDEKDNIKMKIQSSLCAIAIFIASKMDYFLEFVLEKSNKTQNYSSGEKIETMGLLRYRILELIQKILSINQIENLQIKFEKFDFFQIVEMFLQKYKWNNIAHNLLLRIIEHIISQDYQNFKKNHLQQVENYNKGLFGHLIINFRNRKYIFLHSMNMINQGNRNLIFRISKALINEMQQKNDLSKLVQKFKIWKQYMLLDLKQYQAKNYQSSKFFDLKSEQNKAVELRYTSTKMPSQNYHSNKSLQTIEQILNHFKQEEKWSPKYNPKMKKQNLMNNQQFIKMDSLAQYFPPNN